MAALRLLGVHAYCRRRRALPSTFFRPAWPEAPVLETWAKACFAGVNIVQGGLGYFMSDFCRPIADTSSDRFWQVTAYQKLLCASTSVETQTMLRSWRF